MKRRRPSMPLNGNVFVIAKSCMVSKVGLYLVLRASPTVEEVSNSQKPIPYLALDAPQLSS